jgi:AcrR family transcriptional regulator
MATRSVAADHPGELENDEQEDQGDGDGPRDLRPLRCSGVGRYVSHGGRLLLRSWSSETLRDFTRRYAYVKTIRLHIDRLSRICILTQMPKLWTETIEAHRREVRDAILETTVALVSKHALRSVTMSQIAEEAGIGRATLYKYFPDVEAILVAWHERQVNGHLRHLAELRDQEGDPAQRLEAVLEAFALIHHEHHGTDLGALLHRGDHVLRAEQHLRTFIRDLLSEGAKVGVLRKDVAPEELASYCLHALTAAGSLPSKAAVRRLVAVTLAGLRASR